MFIAVGCTPHQSQVVLSIVFPCKSTCTLFCYFYPEKVGSHLLRNVSNFYRFDNVPHPEDHNEVLVCPTTL